MLQRGEAVGAVAHQARCCQPGSRKPGHVCFEMGELAQDVTRLLAGIMGHDAPDLQPVQRQQRADIGLAIVGRKLDAIARHATGIEREVDGQPLAAMALAPQHLQAGGGFRVADQFLDAERERVLHLLWRGRPDADQAAAIAELAGHPRFVIGGEGDIGDAFGNDRRDQQGDTIAVSVRLHHRAQAGAADEAAHLIDIGFEGGGIHLDPAVAPGRPRRRQAVILGIQHRCCGRTCGSQRRHAGEERPAVHQSCPRFRNWPG